MMRGTFGFRAEPTFSNDSGGKDRKINQKQMTMALLKFSERDRNAVLNPRIEEEHRRRRTVTTGHYIL